MYIFNFTYTTKFPSYIYDTPIVLLQDNIQFEHTDTSCRDPPCANPSLLCKLAVIFAQADILSRLL